MTIRTYRLADYVAPGAAFHAAIKGIGPARPPVLHDHDCYELMVVLDGPLRHDLGARTERLAAGTAVFLRPEHAHRVHAMPGGGARIFNLMVRADVAEGLSVRHPELDGALWWGAAPDARDLGPGTRTRLADAAPRLRDGAATALRLEAVLLPLLVDLSGEAEAWGADLPPWLARACRAAMAPEVFRLGAAGLAQVSGRSHEHLCRAMRAHLGRTPSAWVNEVRMDHAARLLRDTDLSVAALADAVGLGNVGHFHRLFRARHGITPGAFRVRARRAPV